MFYHAVHDDCLSTNVNMSKPPLLAPFVVEYVVYYYYLQPLCVFYRLALFAHRMLYVNVC